MKPSRIVSILKPSRVASYIMKPFRIVFYIMRYSRIVSCIMKPSRIVSYNWAASWQNQQNGTCTQRRLRSAWASAQSNQSLRCLYKESLGPQLPIECTAKTQIRLGGCPSWSESSLGTQSFCWFCHEAAQLLISMLLKQENGKESFSFTSQDMKS